MKITVIGGTGYAGAAIVQEAAIRNHEVTSLSRSQPEVELEGVNYIEGSALNQEVLANTVKASQVVVAALSPRGELQGKIGEAYTQLAALASEAGSRLMIVGGFGTLRPSLDKPRFVDGEDFPPEYAPEAKELANVFDWLSAEAPDSLDWVYMSPAGGFGVYNPGTAEKVYRTGGEVALFDEQSNSDISGADFAFAVLDEIEVPTIHDGLISFAY